jgi:hypothetical protein
MALVLDHAFLTCEVGAPEADTLLARGFVEGSGNVHPGQGTANRRFFFANFMLELLWVVDAAEAASEIVRPTGLWDRWSRRAAGASRFGLVYGGELATGTPSPFPTRPYHPAYLPPGMNIDIVTGLTAMEPALFCLPWLTAGRGPRNVEPTAHEAPVRDVTGVAIGIADLAGLSPVARRAQDAGLLTFFAATQPVLEVRFRTREPLTIDCRPGLPLLFRGIADEGAHP